MIFACGLVTRVLSQLRRAPSTPAIVSPVPVGSGGTLLEVQRHPCPFYGFVGVPAFGLSMMDSRGGNPCALTLKHSPCAMEVAGEKPSWDLCSRWNHQANQEDVRRFLEVAKVFPNELWPEGEKSWEGVDGLEWFAKVMGHLFP